MASTGAAVDSSFVSTTFSRSFMVSLIRSGASGSTRLDSVISTAVSSVNTVVVLVGPVAVSATGQIVSVPHFLYY